MPCRGTPMPTTSPLGSSEARTSRSLWDGLECFPAYGDDVEPAPLAPAATTALGAPPTPSGLVDHDQIGAAWEQAHGRTSIVDDAVRTSSRPPHDRPIR